MKLPEKIALNDFATRSFRDVADRDYIAARMLYRYNLGPQFLWAALQALEKYLKAILLFNRHSTKRLRHDIAAAYRRVQTSLTDVPFDFPSEIGTFIAYLNEEGPNRYFEHPSYTRGEELLLLDRAVWFIRRYCYPLRHVIRKPNGDELDMFPYELKRIQVSTPDKAGRVRLFRGFLEDVISERDSQLREHLVWKNFYFGTYKKRVIKKFTRHSWSANPTHYLHPESFAVLDRLVQFSPAVREQFSGSKNK